MRSFPRGAFTVPNLTILPSQAGGGVNEVQGSISVYRLGNVKLKQGIHIHVQDRTCVQTFLIRMNLGLHEGRFVSRYTKEVSNILQL